MTLFVLGHFCPLQTLRYYVHFKICSFLIKIIGVTLVNKIVSCVQFYNTSYVYCIVCLPSKVNLPPSSCIRPPLPCTTSPLTPFPSGNHRTVVYVYEFWGFLFVCLVCSFVVFSFIPWLILLSMVSQVLCCCKWQYFIFSCGWVVFHYI